MWEVNVKECCWKRTNQEHTLWEGVGYMLLFKNIQVFVFRVLEIRSWVRALEAKLPQEKIIRIDATLALSRNVAVD